MDSNATRQELVEALHEAYLKHKTSKIDFVLALSQFMTDMGVSCYNKRTSKSITNVDLSILRQFEQEYYTDPKFDIALILTAALMTTWVNKGEI